MIRYADSSPPKERTSVISVCDVCGAEVTVEFRAVKARRSRGNRDDLCRSCRTKQDWKKPGRGAKLAKLALNRFVPVRTVEARSCERCGCVFHPHWSKRRFCSKRCVHSGVSKTSSHRQALSQSRIQSGVARGAKNPMFGRVARHGRGSWWNGVWFRSTWEVKYAHWLSARGILWEYEPKAFGLSTDQTYRPDFYLPATDEWVEVKGWWRGDAELKWQKFCLEYPTLKKTLLMKAELSALGIDLRFGERGKLK